MYQITYEEMPQISQRKFVLNKILQIEVAPEYKPLRLEPH